MAEARVPVLFILGPTGVGKTEASVLAAEALGAEIVSADSRQIYRGLDIGTAKPPPELLRRVPHHMIDVADPDEAFNAVRYAEGARSAIFDIHGRGRLPMVVGGSGLYVRAVLDGIFLGPPASAEVRTQLMETIRELGSAHLHARLADVDPEAAASIHPNDAVRLVRAMEVFMLTGDPVSRLRERLAEERPPFDGTLLGLTRAREELYKRIDVRVDRMLEAGWVEEVRRLMDTGRLNERSANAVGYGEIAAFLRGSMSLREAAETIKRQTRRYAKRQITWFSRDPRIQWIVLSASTSDREAAAAILARFRAAGSGGGPSRS